MRGFLAMVVALGLFGSQAWAMQNIKCVPADRTARATWTDEAKPVLASLEKARASVAEGGSLSKTTLASVESLGNLSNELEAKVENKELKTALGAVGDSLLGGAKTLPKAGPDAALKTVDGWIELLGSHTAG